MARTDLVGRAVSVASPPGGQPAHRGARRARRHAGRHGEGHGHRRRTRLCRRTPAQRFTHVVHEAAERFASRSAQGRVAVFPTCLVEYQNTGRRQRPRARSTSATASSATLHRGARRAAARRCCTAATSTGFHQQVARDNVAALAAAVRAGRDIVVPQPTCGYVLKQDYPDYAPGSRRRARRRQHLRRGRVPDEGAQVATGGSLDTHVRPARCPETITYHAPCHLRAQNIGLRAATCSS